MKWFAVAILFMVPIEFMYGQSIKEIKPELGHLINKSLQGEIEFIKLQDKCEKFWSERQYDFDEHKMTDPKKSSTKNVTILRDMKAIGM